MAKKQSQSKYNQDIETQIIHLHATADGQMSPSSEKEIKHLTRVAVRRREESRQKRIEANVKIQKQTANEVSVLQRIALGGLIFLLLLCCVSFVQLYANVSAARTKVASLRTEYTAAVESTRILEEKINDAIAPQEILRYAMEELQMVYPDSSQVITYQKDNSRRVIANEKIPEE